MPYIFRLRLNQSDPSCTESDTDDPDKMSIGSTHPKPTSCFRCHPRRWRHQACCFRRAVTSKAGHHQAHNHNATSIKSSFKPKIITTQSQDADGISDPGSLLNASTDELQVHPMGGVASMISSVVSQTANVAATTAGSKVPTKSTFGRRNIKNQVSPDLDSLIGNTQCGNLKRFLLLRFTERKLPFCPFEQL